MPTFVQFMHPGVEPDISRVTAPVCPANHGKTHKRKFLAARGDYVDSHNTRNSGQFTFWGEWELASTAQQVIPRSSEPGMPRYIHHPFWPQVVSIAPGGGYCGKQPPNRRGGSGSIASRGIHSTDPFVFCEPILYLHCQIRPGCILDKLQPCDIVAFGSHLRGQFVLDTLFVVADRVDVADPALCSEFAQVNSSHFSGAAQQVYLGATFNKPVDGMFSFFPAMPFDGVAPRVFKRPVIKSTGVLSGHINPALTQRHRLSRPPSNFPIWDEIRTKVLRNGNVLGLQANL